jgi:hypothetical protein
MDKEELKKLVGIAFSHWNQGIASTGKGLDNILGAWGDALHDITYKEAVNAVNHLAITETYLPRPFQIRKQALILAGKVKPAPPGSAAWAILQNVARDVNTGAIEPSNMHEVVLTTLQRMGGVGAISAATNGDRAFFLDVYKDVLGEWEAQAYGLTE